MSSPLAAQRVASTIGTVKWVLIAALALFAVLTVFASINADDGTATALGLGGAVSLALSAVMTWVLFGWFEHTLSMLSQVASTVSQVALNTSRPGETSLAAGNSHTGMQHV